MALNPFAPPTQTERSVRRSASISGWWIAVPYFVPLMIMITAMNEAGWYGTGIAGWLQGLFRIIVFFIGVACAYYALIFGSNMQRVVAAPVALGYTALVIGILWDHYL